MFENIIIVASILGTQVANFSQHNDYNYFVQISFGFVWPIIIVMQIIFMLYITVCHLALIIIL